MTAKLGRPHTTHIVVASPRENRDLGQWKCRRCGIRFDVVGPMDELAAEQEPNSQIPPGALLTRE